MNCYFNLSVQWQSNILSNYLEISERSVLWVCGHVTCSTLQLLFLTGIPWTITFAAIIYCFFVIILRKTKTVNEAYTIKTCPPYKKEKKKRKENG